MLWILFSLATASLLSEDLYERLQVSKTATEREIRVAFKKLAIEKHPDKNPTDENAHAKMVELNQALSILTDPDQRMAYDKGGGIKAAEEANKGAKGWGNAPGAQDLNFYQNFGLYDSDPAIQVIDYHFWEASHYSTDAWLITFYDPNCEKCTEMAEDWRRVGAALHGAFHVGAVNCDTDFPVCKSVGVTALPTIVLFKKGESRNTQTPIVFTEQTSFENIMSFAMTNLPNVVTPLLPDNFQSNSPLPYGGTKGSLWIVGYCNNHDACESLSAKMKLISMIVNDLLPMGQVNCEAFADLCKRLGTYDDSSDNAVIITYEHAHQHKATLTTDIREIAHGALKKLEPLPLLSLELLTEVTENIFATGARVHKTVKNPREYLVLCIDQEGCNDETPELGPGSSLCYQTLLAFRQVLNALSVVWEYGELSPGVFNCNLEAQARDERVKKMCNGIGTEHGNPEVVILKEGALNAFEYHDRIDRTEQVLAFVQETYRSTVHELTHEDFEAHIIKEKQTWFVDFFAPWCHHCRDVWPEWNQASKHYDLPKDVQVHFGKINCEEHHEQCLEQHIRGYPTFLLYHDGVRHQFDFDHRTAEEFVRFIKETLEPVETEFTVDSYERIMNPHGKSPATTEELAEYTDQRWVVDFFAPWCSHCHVMSPKFREAAKALRGVVKFGKLNCELDAQYCMRLGIRAYPTIWRFEPGYTRSRPTAEYPGLPDPKLILDFAMQAVEDSVTVLDAATFRSYVREGGDEQSWVVFFWTSVSKDCPECERVMLKLKALASRYKAKELKQQHNAQRLDPVASNRAIQLNFGAFNCRASGQDNLLCVSERIKRFPTVMFYSGANNEQKPISLDDTLKAISEIDANLAADRRAIVHPFREKPEFQFHVDL